MRIGSKPILKSCPCPLHKAELSSLILHVRQRRKFRTRDSSNFLQFFRSPGAENVKITVDHRNYFLFSVLTFSQSQSTTGNIEGRVTDPNGAGRPGCRITGTNQDTGFNKSTISDQDGKFILPLLPSGRYKVTVGAASGFAGAAYENVVVTVGAKTTLNVDLKAGGTVGVVDVSGEGQGVELTRTSVSSTVDETKVINLPTNGRNFLDFATLVPGVVRDPTRAGDLAIGGQKGTLTVCRSTESQAITHFLANRPAELVPAVLPSEFSIDTVKEFQVNTNGFSAEYGRAAGGVINAITKSGANTFSGSAYEYFRDESLDARNPNLVAVNRHRPAGQINQFGGTIGGPFKRDKAFFFGAYEGQRSNLPNPVILNSLPFAPANVQAFLGPKAASYNVDRIQDTYLVKTDFNINQQNLVWIRFNQQNFKGTNLENGGSLGPSSTPATATSRPRPLLARGRQPSGRRGLTNFDISIRAIGSRVSQIRPTPKLQFPPVPAALPTGRSTGAEIISARVKPP